MIKIQKDYICFSYKGDEILYIYPWKREKFSHRFISIGCNGVFQSLKEIDIFWDEYNDSFTKNFPEEDFLEN